MPSSADNLGRPQPGSTITAEYLRRMSDRVNRIGRDEREQDLSPFSPIIKLPLQRFVVKSVSDDHLVCRLWDGFTEGTVDIKVAKPWDLRKKPFHGKTRTIDGSKYTYTYTSEIERSVNKKDSSNNDLGTETQTIIPRYVATSTDTAFKGNEIWAVRCDTGVVLNEGQSSEERLTLMDVNVAGRAWAKK